MCPRRSCSLVKDEAMFAVDANLETHGCFVTAWFGSCVLSLRLFLFCGFQFIELFVSQLSIAFLARLLDVAWRGQQFADLRGVSKIGRAVVEGILWCCCLVAGESRCVTSDSWKETTVA